jgi:hypothetical protein
MRQWLLRRSLVCGAALVALLLGKPKPDWMEKGVPFLDKGKRDVTDMFKVKETTRPTTESAAVK